MSNNPLISIVTPVRNDVSYIEKCIQNVLSQDYPNLEHVIIDGASTDGTLDIISDYSKKYPERIRFISEPDKGGGDAWNKGLKIAKGEIFGILGADDLYLSGAIKEIADFFIAHPEAYFVHGNCENIDENGRLIWLHTVEKFNFKDFINTARHISTTSAFYRREVMEKIGWLDRSGDDFDVMIRIAKEFKVYSIDKVISKLTVRRESAYNSLTVLSLLKKARRETFIISRRYGGSIFSPLALRYYIIATFNFLHLSSAFFCLKRLWQFLGVSKRKSF